MMSDFDSAASDGGLQQGDFADNSSFIVNDSLTDDQVSWAYRELNRALTTQQSKRGLKDDRAILSLKSFLAPKLPMSFGGWLWQRCLAVVNWLKVCLVGAVVVPLVQKLKKCRVLENNLLQNNVSVK